MSTKAESLLTNFAAGELSPKVWGRADLPLYKNGTKRMVNFVAQTQGPARFRDGFTYVNHTRRNKAAYLVNFQFNDQQAYVLEFTDGYMRVFKDEAPVLETAKNITGATAANPVVITSNSHGFSNGDEVYITGVVGMTQLNGKYYLVANKTANTFELTDQDGNNINGTAFTAYSSGGTVARIYELTTPYAEADNLFLLRYTQNADTMYFVHPYYEPRKLTRSGHASWSLSLFTRTADPFLSKKTITGASQANPCQITSVAHGLSTGDVVIIEGIVGMTQLNGRYFTITNTGANTFTLDGVNSTSYTAWSSGGYASLRNLLPSVVAFYESRLFYASTDAAPQKFWGSRAPDSSGNTRYDDFTTGTDADHAVIYSIASQEVNEIHWLMGMDRQLCVGTFGGTFKITGDTAEAAISPTSINVRPIDSYGTLAIRPINKENVVIYVQREGLNFWSIEFDALSDSYVAIDRSLVADHITASGVKQIAYQSGRPGLVWAVLNNGKLIGCTWKSREDVSGWHRHNTGDDSFLAITVIPRDTQYEQVWVVVERSVDGHTRRYIEYMNDEVVIPQFVDFYTGPENKTEDYARFLRAMFEAQKEYVHVDSALTYDGTDSGLDAGASVTPAAVSGASVTFTASASVFKASDVGRQIWKKAIDGDGYGRAEITGYTSATQVTCRILVTFDSVDAIAAGEWYLTTDEVSGLEHLEGRTVSIIADGGVEEDAVVTDGALTLSAQYSVVHIGLGYTGFIQTLPIEAGGTTGPAQTKRKYVHRFGLRVLATFGFYYGTDLYRMSRHLSRSSADTMNRPAPLETRDLELPYEDQWESEKTIFIQQRKPLPCIVESIMPFSDTTNK